LNPNSQNGKNLYYGVDSAKFGSNSKQNSDFKTANFAFMIFDKKVNGFRIVPITKHIAFEK